MFRGDSANEERSELVLLVTPHIYSGGPEGERLARERLARSSRNTDLESKVLSESAAGVPAVNLRGQQQEYVPLTRYAAALRHGLLPSETGAYRGIDAVEISSGGGLRLLGGSGITAEPVESWRKRNLFVTAVVLTNTTDKPQPVRVGNLRGNWLAATAEVDTLKPRNQAGSRTYLYLISNRPFGEVISHLQAGGGL